MVLTLNTIKLIILTERTTPLPVYQDATLIQEFLSKLSSVYFLTLSLTIQIKIPDL